MNRKLLIPVLAAALVGCQDAIDAPSAANAAMDGSVQFSTYVGRGASRAAVVNTANLNAFGVFGYMGGTSGFDPAASIPDFMYNQLVERDGAGGNTWHYSPVKYWPQDDALKTAFFAYAPYSATADIAPVTDEAVSAIVEASANTAVGNPTIRYHVGTDVARQQDLIYASTGDLTNAAKTVDLEFNHALSRVAFKVKGWEADDPNSIYGEGTTVTVNSVKLATKRKEATLDLGTGAWSDPDNSSEWRGYAITPNSGMVANAKSDDILEDNDIFQIGSGSTEVMNLTADDGYVMLLPEIDPADNDKYMLFVDYTVRTEDDALAGGFVEYRNNVYRFFTPHFEQGKAYAITIHLGMNGTPGPDDGDYDEPFDPEDEPDNDPENPAHPASEVAEIAFSQSVIDWDSAADKNLNYTGEYRYVDLGLPSGTLWAVCNLGADNPEDLGDFYAWGETTPKTSFSWDTYMCTQAECGTDADPLKDVDNIAGTQWDAAYKLSAGREVMPSIQQCSELALYCDEEEVTVNGKRCIKLTSQINGESILIPRLPMDGVENSYNTDPAGDAYLWTASQRSYLDERTNPAESNKTAMRYTNSNCGDPCNYIERRNGFNIRPVKNIQSAYAYPEWLKAEVDERGNVHCVLTAQNGRMMTMGGSETAVLLVDSYGNSYTNYFIDVYAHEPMALSTQIDAEFEINMGIDNINVFGIDVDRDYYIVTTNGPTKYISNPIRFTEEMISYGRSKMIYTIRTITANEAVSLPFVNGTCPAGLTINWGDGTRLANVTTIDSSNNKHTYASAGDYTITIVSAEKDVTKQQVPNYNNTESLHFPEQLVSLNTPLLHSGQTNLSRLFYNCESLTSIPAGLFYYCPEVTTFTETFRGCKALTSIPTGLFDNCTEVVDVLGAFWECYALTNIPEHLFDNCTEVSNFMGTFAGCKALTSIPEGLFDHNTEVTNFTETFRWCHNLTRIPAGLFDNCTKVTSFLCVFGNCRILTTIPAGLFDNCTEVTDFGNAFGECYALTNIPEHLFDNCTEVTDFSGAFYYCTGLSSIPEHLFDNCTEVKTFDNAFKCCKGITSIPEGLFDYNTKVRDFTGVFAFCRSLTSVPEHLFDNCTEVKFFGREYFSGAFEECSAVTSNVPELWDSSKWPNVKMYSGCFKNCTNAANYDDIPSGWK